MSIVGRPVIITVIFVFAKTVGLRQQALDISGSCGILRSWESRNDLCYRLSSYDGRTMGCSYWLFEQSAQAKGEIKRREVMMGRVALLVGFLSVGVFAAELTVGETDPIDGPLNFTVEQGRVFDLDIYGRVSALEGLVGGYDIVVQLVPQADAFGTLEFTSANTEQEADIVELGDPFGGGIFTFEDTGWSQTASGTGTQSLVMNDASKTTPTSLIFVEYEGPLVRFPVVASVDAVGTWDVSLVFTSVGFASQWSPSSTLSTTLIEGTITVIPVQPAELKIRSISIRAGGVGDIVVSGKIDGQGAAGVTLMLEITPHAGALGTVVFTSSPPVDIVQLGDPWPGMGLFSSFDTDSPGVTSTLNGSVDDNGLGLVEPVFFNGLLASFPVVASVDANGRWDVTLSTVAGFSKWNNGTPMGVPVIFINGSVSISGSHGGVGVVDTFPPRNLSASRYRK